jgi:prevent-host-death family protein
MTSTYLTVSRCGNVALSATFPPMTRIISQRELRNDSADIMRRLESGESFIITRHGKQIGVLSPMHRPQFSKMADVCDAFQGLAPLSYDDLRRDIDTYVNQDTTPRFLRD